MSKRKRSRNRRWKLERVYLNPFGEKVYAFRVTSHKGKPRGYAVCLFEEFWGHKP